MKHLSFVGMMGSGKTTVANLAAEKLNMPFVDLDQIVEDRIQLSIAEIFKRDGEEKFRQYESDALKEELTSSKPSVIATGGGVVLSEENCHLLKEHSIVVWLSVEPEVLEYRVSQVNPKQKDRPLLSGDETVLEALTRIYSERKELYRKVADLALGGEILGATKLADKSIYHYESAIAREREKD